MSGLAPVSLIARVGDDGSIYRGTASGVAQKSGSLSMANEAGNKCNAEFQFADPTSGSGVLRCSNGQIATLRLRAFTTLSGFGEGKTGAGEVIRLAYGFTEDRGLAHVSGQDDPSRDDADDDTPNPEKDRKPGSARDGSRSGRSPARYTSGTGFYFNGEGHILTNNHVVARCREKEIEAHLADEPAQKASIIATDATSDLAVIKVKSRPRAFGSFLASARYRPGDTLVVYGFPLPNALSSTGVLTTGTISALSGFADNSNRLQMSTPIQPGNSGGPVVDAEGNVIAIVVAGLVAPKAARDAGNIPQNVNFAIKDVTVKTFLQSHNIPFAITTGNAARQKSLSLSDIGEQMRSYVVQVRCRLV